MMSRTKSLAALLAIGALLAMPMASAQNETNDNDVNIDAPDVVDNDNDGEEATGPWWGSSSVVLVLFVLAVVVIALVVAVAARRP